MKKNKKGKLKSVVLRGLFKVGKTHYEIVCDNKVFGVDKENFDFDSKFVEDSDYIEAFYVFSRAPRAKLVKVVQRHSRFFVGYSRKVNGIFYFEPLKTKFLIKLDRAIPENELIKVDIQQSKNKAIAQVLEIYENDASNDEQIVVDKYNLNSIFSEAVLYEAEKIPEPSELDFKGRIDFRGLSTVTIDGQDAKDFDDAIDVEILKNGYRLYVHIADVSHYVKEASSLDKEASKRGFSVYFPQSCLPMLPHRLSDNLCSLVPNKDRLSFSVVMDFDNKGKRKSYKFVKSVIRNKHRLNYDFVEQCLNNEIDCEENLKKYLQQIKILAKILRARRFLKGSIDLDIKEASYVIENNEIVNILPRKRLFSYKIIEEFMLAANKTVADFLSSKVPFLRRIHKKPQSLKLLNLSSTLKQMGYSFPARANAKKIDTFLHQLNCDERSIVSKLILRSLERAEYSTATFGHFALGFENYTHFTSPIRRYPDLVIHRILSKVLTNKKPYTIDVLDKIAIRVQKMELISESSEYFMRDIKQARLISAHLGEVFNGTIVSMIGSGMFVELKEILADGFLPFVSLKDDYYIFNEAKQIVVGRKTAKTYKLGDKIRIIPTNVDIYMGKIDLKLAEEQ